MKRAIGFLLIIVMMMSSVGFAASQPSSWAQEAYYYMNYYDILGKDLATMTKLSHAITREEFAEITVRVYAASKGISVEAIDRNPAFVDTNNAYVERAYELGIVNGVDATHFNPTDNVTREGIATMLTRMMKILNVNTSYTGNPNISDDHLISSWAKDAMYFCRINGILNGVGTDANGRTITAPQDLATREQSIVLCFNIMKKYSWIKQYGDVQGKALNGKIVYDDVSNALESYAKGSNVGLISNPLGAFTAAPDVDKHHYYIYKTALANGMSYPAVISLTDDLKEWYNSTGKSYDSVNGYMDGVIGIYRTNPFNGKQFKILGDGILMIEFMD